MKHPFERCVIITNSTSTNYRRAKRLTREVKKYFTDDQVDVIEITASELDAIDRLIDEMVGGLNSKTLVCIGGGDGSIGVFINRLILTPGLSKEARQAVILPLWGGNANDLAYMLNGTAYAVNMRKILSRGRIVKVYPLEVNISAGKVRRRLASNYVSFGMSAYAAEELNKLGVQNVIYRTFKELGSVLKAAMHFKPFRVEIDGRQKILYDLILINGSRIAKVYRAPNRLTDRSFFELVIDRKRPLLLSYPARIIQGMTFKRTRRSNHSLVVQDKTWAQLDGEVVEIPKGSKIEISTCATPFRVLSTKLK